MALVLVCLLLRFRSPRLPRIPVTVEVIRPLLVDSCGRTVLTAVVIFSGVVRVGASVVGPGELPGGVVGSSVAITDGPDVWVVGV